MKTTINAIAAAVLVLAASPSHALLKCTVDGKVVYQDTPCLGGKGTAIKAPDAPAAPPAAGKQRSGASHPAADDSTRKASEEAFQRHMASGDYARAAAFATDEKQKNKAREALHKKEEKCNDLRIKRDEADANAKGKGDRLRPAAEAAQARYDAACRL